MKISPCPLRGSLGRPLISWLGTLVLSGCASTLYLPSARMEAPQTLGLGKSGQIDFGNQTGPWLLADALPRTDSDGKALTPALQVSPLNPTFQYSLPLGPRTDGAIRLSSHAPPILSIKHQVLGATCSEADSRGFSAALSAAAGFLAGRTEDNSTYTYALAEAGFPVGYRWTGRAWTSTISLTPTLRWASVQGDSLAQAGSTLLYGASLGYQIESESLILRAEPNWTQGTYNGAEAGGWGAAVSFGLRIPKKGPSSLRSAETL